MIHKTKAMTGGCFMDKEKKEKIAVFRLGLLFPDCIYQYKLGS